MQVSQGEQQVPAGHLVPALDGAVPADPVQLVEATRHHVLAAFGWGQCTVRPAGSPVRWVPDPAQVACPDCEDDALAGTVPSGGPFPTGHTHPPAHPGCRCLVIGARVGASV